MTPFTDTEPPRALVLEQTRILSNSIDNISVLQKIENESSQTSKTKTGLRPLLESIVGNYSSSAKLNNIELTIAKPEQAVDLQIFQDHLNLLVRALLDIFIRECNNKVIINYDTNHLEIKGDGKGVVEELGILDTLEPRPIKFTGLSLLTIKRICQQYDYNLVVDDSSQSVVDLRFS